MIFFGGDMYDGGVAAVCGIASVVLTQSHHNVIYRDLTDALLVLRASLRWPPGTWE